MRYKDELLLWYGMVAWIIFGAIALIFNTPLRRVISSMLMHLLIKMKFIPKISDTMYLILF